MNEITGSLPEVVKMLARWVIDPRYSMEKWSRSILRGIRWRFRN